MQSGMRVYAKSYCCQWYAKTSMGQPLRHTATTMHTYSPTLLCTRLVCLRVVSLSLTEPCTSYSQCQIRKPWPTSRGNRSIGSSRLPCDASNITQCMRNQAHRYHDSGNRGEPTDALYVILTMSNSSALVHLNRSSEQRIVATAS